MKSYDVGDRSFDWPNNMISTRAAVLQSGAIVFKDQVPDRRVDTKEIDRCKQLAEEAVSVGGPPLDFDIGSETSSPLWPFYIAAAVDEKPKKRITSNLIRSKFGGTLYPPTTITVEPLNEKGIWWREVIESSGVEGDELEEYLLPYRMMNDWFNHPGRFVSSAFIRIGDRSELWDVDESDRPKGTECSPSVLPRLAVGLNEKGSLIGIFGYTVQT